jgi:hypothetical protein
MKTVLVSAGAGAATGKEARVVEDAPQVDDPTVDCVLEDANEIRDKLPELWEGGIFAPPP